MNTTDKQFFITFTGITGVLIIITVIVLVAANMLGSANNPGGKSAGQIKIAKARIEPIGKVNLKSNPVVKVSSDSATTLAANTQPQSKSLAIEDQGQTIYNGICQSCHATGAAGAPIVGDIQAWKGRLTAGIEALYAASINGKGLMPAKGGNPALSDAEVKAAVDYMIKSSK